VRHAIRALFFVPLLAGGFFPVELAAQAPAGWEPFSRQFRDYVRDDSIVGASVALVKNGAITARLDLGQQDRARQVAVSGRSIFHWGSITKSLTAIAIMQLRDRGRLSLDDPITRYVPELRQLHDPFGMIDQITLRMLLSHSAGFRNGTWPYGDGKPWQPFEPTTWNQLVAMMPYQELLFKPGTRYSYSNPAFVYLARVVEQLTGDPWDSYVQKNIFAPLGMTHSYFRNTPYYLAANRSHNYTAQRDSASSSVRMIDNGADFDPGITTPNGGWNSPVSDLVRYVAFLTNTEPLNGSTVNYNTVLSRASLAEMWTPVVPMAQGYEAGTNQSMGLSFFLIGSGDQRVIGHTGSQAGFRSFFYFNPKTTAGVIAVFNTTNEAAPAAAQYRAMHAAAQTLIR
jgi:CubicO group peptidase (beta-lactamase class C family)